jgi:hypothetical protein
MLDKNKILLRLKDNTKIIIDGCWLWKGGADGYGYGVIQIENKNYRVHRLSAWIHYDLDLNDSKQVTRHKHNICKNKHCWNPNHITIGTQEDNLRDQIVNGTHRSLRFKERTNCSVCNRPYLPDNLITAGKGRECKFCRNRRSREFYARKRLKLKVK